MQQDQPKLLLIQTAFLGDIILTTPVIRAIRQRFPDSHLTVLTIPGTAILFRYHPAVADVWVFDKRKWFRKIISFWRVLRQIRKRDFAIAFSVQSSFTSSLLMFLGGIPERIGFRRQRLTTRKALHPRGLPIRERYLYLLHPFGEVNESAETEIFWSEAEAQKAQRILNPIREENRPVIGIAPGSVWPTKRWPTEYFIELGKMLRDDLITMLFIGGPGDRALCQRIADQLGDHSHNLAGALSVLESAALIEGLDLMISNDSAPLHMANAVDTPAFAFFGPTVRRFGCFPYRPQDCVFEVDLDCRPCSKHGGRRCPQGHFRCMLDIRPRQVHAEIQRFMENRGTHG